MRVLTIGNMYPPHHQGGYELIWRSAVERMRADGHQLRVLTTDHREPDPDPAIAEDPDVHRELRWYWHEYEFPRLPLRRRLELERHNLAALDRQIADFRPDVLSWWAMGGMSMSLLERGRDAGLPAVGVVIDEWMTYGPLVDGWQRAFDRPLIGRLTEALTGIPTGVDVAAAAEWIFVSAYVRDRAIVGGFAVHGSALVHGGIDLSEFEAAPEHEWTGRLLTLGRIDPRKGIATAVRALAELPDCALRCVGGGDPRHLAELRELAAGLGVADRVGFDQVPRDLVASAYAEADVLAFCASWPEPFGLVPLESMAVGTPVIATGTGGSAEYLREAENCLLIPPDDPPALAAAVRRLAADPELRQRLRSGGRRTAEQHTESAFNEAVIAAHERLVS